MHAVTRTIQSAASTHKGLIWPQNIASARASVSPVLLQAPARRRAMPNRQVHHCNSAAMLRYPEHSRNGTDSVSVVSSLHHARLAGSPPRINWDQDQKMDSNRLSVGCSSGAAGVVSGMSAGVGPIKLAGSFCLVQGG